MGEQYRKTLEDKIREIGSESLRVYINADGIDPHYKKHLEDTFKDARVAVVLNREEANFIFEGGCEPSYHEGQIVAFFRGNELLFAGAL